MPADFSWELSGSSPSPGPYVSAPPIFGHDVRKIFGGIGFANVPGGRPQYFLNDLHNRTEDIKMVSSDNVTSPIAFSGVIKFRFSKRRRKTSFTGSGQFVNFLLDY